MRSGTGRLVAAGLLAALGTLLSGALLSGTPAGAADPVFGLTVNPTHGPATATVHASYRTPGLPGGCPHEASFAWDGLPVGTARLTIVGRSCLYLLSFVPPALDRAPGPHSVEATAATTAATVYRIDPTASPSASPSAKASPTPKPSRTRATPTPTESTEDVPPPPATTSDQSAPVAPAGIPTQVAAPASHWTAWVMVVGGALVLGGVLVIGWLVLQNRRAGRVDDDAPTVEQPRLDAG